MTKNVFIEKIEMLGYTKEDLIKNTGLSPDVLERLFTDADPSLTPEEQKILDDWMQRAAIPIKKPGTYTLEDYMALPEECRAELIDGNLYRMDAPSFIHQIIGGELYRQISNYIISHKGKCIACTAPADILLDRDDRTAVQPDVFVICDRSNITRQHGMGAPDLVIEVLSPSTKKKDMNLKRDKYQRAGVREYWMIDPDKQKVIVETFEGEQDITIYSFTNKIPVHIFQDNCEIDFAQIYEQVKFLFEV